MFNIEFSVFYCEYAVHEKYAVVIEFLLDYVQYLFLRDSVLVSCVNSGVLQPRNKTVIL
jgi:hypothetical protein